MTQNLDNIYQSFRIYLDEVYLARKKYDDLIPLSIGYPIGQTLKLPDEILDALSVRQNGKEIERLGYGWNFNTSLLKEKISIYENVKNKTNYTSQNVALTAGGTHAVNKVVEYLIPKSNDCEIIVASPAFYKLFGLIQKYAKIVPVSGTSLDSFIPDSKTILNFVTDKTRIIFISNPSNPAYKFYPSNELQKIIGFAESNNISVLLDEVGDAFRYTDYVYPPNIMSPNVIRINSASKFLMLAEYSLGYVLSNSDLPMGISRAISDEMGHIPYAGCLGWLKGTELEEKRLKHNVNTSYESVFNSNLRYLEFNKNYTIKKLNKSKSINNVVSPDACFSLIFSFKKSGYSDDISLFKSLLSEARVSLVPGSGFGINAFDLYFRLTFAINKNVLKEGLERILKFAENY